MLLACLAIQIYIAQELEGILQYLTAGAQSYTSWQLTGDAEKIKTTYGLNWEKMEQVAGSNVHN